MRIYLVATVSFLFACSSSPSATTDTGVSGADAGSAKDASSEMGAEKAIGPEGGTLSLGPISIDVRAGAVAASTTFRIQQSDRSPTLPASTRAISPLYRLEPAQRFAAPVRVSFTVDRSKVPARMGATDGLLLLRAPSGTNDFEAIGAADLAATAIAGDTSEFSDFVVVLFQLAGCDLPDPMNCSGSCDSLHPEQCTGSCSIVTTSGDFTASCALDQARLEVACTCMSSDPNRTPVVSGALYIPTLLFGGAGPLTAHTFLSRCGWPCGSPAGDAGTPMDAEPVDSGSADAGVAMMDAASPMDASAVEQLAPATSMYFPDSLTLAGTDLYASGGSITHIDLTTGTANQLLAATGMVDSIWRVGANLFFLGATDILATVYDDADGDPLKLTRIPLIPGTPMDVAPNAIAFAGDATNVYYSDATGIHALPKAGGNATRLSDTPPAAPASGAVDGTYLYTLGVTTVLGQLFKIPLAGGTPITLASGSGGPGTILVDGDVIYWGSTTVGNIVKVDRNTGTVTPWSMGHYGIRQMAQTATDVYWSQTEQDSTRSILRKYKTSNDLPVVLLDHWTGPEIWGLAVDAQYIYFSVAASPGAIYRIHR
ncbi:MAG: hypothetical protein U1E65_01100 [Myxococcota bacterium]